MRRLIAMMAIGLTHALLLRNGDILVPYATMGFVLLLFRNLSDRGLIIAAIASSFVALIAEFAWEASGIPFPTRPSTDGMSHLAANLLWVKYWYSTAITLWPNSLPMFFVGAYVGRRRLLENVATHRTALRVLAVGGFILGLLLMAAQIWLMSVAKPGNDNPAWLGMLIVYGRNAHAWPLAASYIATILLLLQRKFWRRVLSPLAPVGRMALTNYLMQAAVIVPICIVFDLYDHVTPSFGLLIAILLWSFQVPFSVLWLKHFRFGPAEWLWRSLTYKRAQPMNYTIKRVPHAAALHAVE